MRRNTRATWSVLLAAVPESRLILRSSGLYNDETLASLRQNLSTALGIATDKRVPAALSTKLVTQINEAFVAGMHRGVLFAAAATLIGAIVVFRFLPARGTDPEQIEALISQAVGAWAFRKYRRSPLIIPVVVDA